VFFSFISLKESASLVLLARGYTDKQQEKASRQANKHTRKKQKNNEENRTEKHK
jgi:hypothetical protein